MSDKSDESGSPVFLHRRVLSATPSSRTFTSLLFILTFLVVGSLAYESLFPLLATRTRAKPAKLDRHHELRTPSDYHARLSRYALPKPTARQIAAFAFATSIALSALLAELVFCEVSNSLNAEARSLAFRITLSALLVLSVIVVPAIEIYSLVSKAGFNIGGTYSSKLRVGWLLELVGLAVWLLLFWWTGQLLPRGYLHEETDERDHSLVEGCLERIGIIGISLMASLSGFAAVSSVWQAIGAKARPVTESTVARKQAAIDATDDIITAKQSRLRALDRKLADAPQEGFMTRVMGTIRGSGAGRERQALNLEISGLTDMRSALETSLKALGARRQIQLRATTSHGRLLNSASYIFSFYCMYRILSTLLTSVRHMAAASSGSPIQPTDPVTRFLALLAKHWDPTLDVPSWSRQVSFLLAAVMLLASFSAVFQTFVLFTRFIPSALTRLKLTLPLLISQITAVYVVSSALLLRSSLPKEMGGVISDALGARLSPSIVDRWFEGWFLGVSTLTAVGIFVGKKMGGSLADWDEDDLGDIEMGKRS